MSGDGVGTSVLDVDPPVGPPTARRPAVDRIFAGPPGWPFHVVTALAALALLWAASVPFGSFLVGMAAALALLALAGLWVLRGIGYLVCRAQRRPTTGRTGWWLVAPIGALLVVALLATDVPLRARWAASRADFEEVVAASEGTDGAVDVDGRLGLYDISSAIRDGESVVFYETTGGFIDMVGFAHLPDGPQPLRARHAGESVQVRHLEGDWYTFAASW